MSRKAAAAGSGGTESILASLVEGVLAVDAGGRLLAMNPAAGRMLGVEAGAARGRRLGEAVASPALREFMAEALAAAGPVETDIVLGAAGAERFVQARGNALRDASGRRLGAVISLNDATRLRRLETLRRDFVANVSHELKTPITSIKGFVETLLDGALDSPADARNFLEITAKQADRLNAIIEDLLLLSRLEQDDEKRDISLEDARLADALGNAMEVCGLKAAAKRVALRLDCPRNLTARINPALIEQAVVNLIDNAVKYSEPGGAVRVEAGRRRGAVVICVRDRGSGIEKSHLPHLFERFYRVDKARSRKLGGTGLGLAIVKHIAQVHGGSVIVESTPGEGSAFCIRLPAGTIRRLEKKQQK